MTACWDIASRGVVDTIGNDHEDRPSMPPGGVDQDEVAGGESCEIFEPRRMGDLQHSLLDVGEVGLMVQYRVRSASQGAANQRCGYP